MLVILNEREVIAIVWMFVRDGFCGKLRNVGYNYGALSKVVETYRNCISNDGAKVYPLKEQMLSGNIRLAGVSNGKIAQSL